MDRASHIFARALDDLKTRHGIDCGALAPDETVALVRACEKAADPFADVNADAAGFPVRVADGVHFWRLTIGASVWLDRVERLLPAGNADERYRLALVYACANSRRREAFDGLDTLAAVTKAVRRFMRTVRATPEEVNVALDRLFGLRPDTRQDDVTPAAADWAAICARLESQTGIPADEWLWNRSGGYAIRCYNDLHAFAEAYAGDTGRARHMTDELDEAVNALQRLKLAIANRHGGTNG